MFCQRCYRKSSNYEGFLVLRASIVSRFGKEYEIYFPQGEMLMVEESMDSIYQLSDFC